MITFTELLERTKNEDIAVHTPREEQARALLKTLDKRGYIWSYGDKLTTRTWHEIFCESTCYRFDLNTKVYSCPLDFYQKGDYIVVEFSDIVFKEE